MNISICMCVFACLHTHTTVLSVVLRMNVPQFSVFFFPDPGAIHKIAKAFARTNDLKHVGTSDFPDTCG